MYLGIDVSERDTQTPLVQKQSHHAVVKKTTVTALCYLILVIPPHRTHFSTFQRS